MGRKARTPGKCLVCGDNACGINYNVPSCMSCKTFFRRNALRQTNETICQFSDCCTLDRITRKFCPKCRLMKCLEVGMNKEMIKTEDEKRELQEKIRLNRIKRLEGSTNFETKINRISLISNESTLNLKMYEQSRLQEIYRAALAFSNESTWKIVGQVDKVSQLVNISAASIKPIIRFCKKVTEFNCLTKDEQVIALKCFVPEIDLIRAAFNYNAETNGWPALEHPECDKRAVFVKMEFFKSLTDLEHCNFFSNFIIDLHREVENDPAIRDLILIQLVFKHRPKIEHNIEFMQYHNAVFHYLLRRYLEHKYLDTNRAAQKYTSLMGLLTKMGPIAIGIRDFFIGQDSTTQVAPVLRELYNLGQK